MQAPAWQIALTAADRYEASLVPALMARWSPHLVNRASIAAGHRVLDVACGTGIAARTAAEHAGSGGHVTGVDINPAMLAVASRIAPQIDWREGDAAALPFDDGAFDRVLCQFALMFFPDRVVALGEMRRVARRGGRVAIATCGAMEASEPYRRQAAVVERIAGTPAAEIVRSPFTLPDPNELQSLLRSAGFVDVEADELPGIVSYPSVAAFIEGEIDATPLGSHLLALGEEVYEEVKSATSDMLRPIVAPGGLTFPFRAVIATGARP